MTNQGLDIDILYIDHKDSFAHNIKDCLARTGARVTMISSGASMKTVRSHPRDIIVLGSGPNGPKQSGNYMEVIDTEHKLVPMLGVCLGHQTMGEYFGLRVAPLGEPAHGKPAKIEHDRIRIYQNIPLGVEMGRFHSLGILSEDIKSPLGETASYNGIVMGFEHYRLPIIGVQFHPDSELSNMTPERYGEQLVRNIVRYLDSRRT